MDESSRKLGVVPGKPVELAAVAVRRAAVRCIAISSKQPVVLRGGLFAVEGEILTVKPKKVWRFGNTINLSGEVQSIMILSWNWRNATTRWGWESGSLLWERISRIFFPGASWTIGLSCAAIMVWDWRCGV